MSLSNTRLWTVVLGGLLMSAGWAAAQNQTNIAPRAEQVLRAACQYLAETPFYSLAAEIWREHVNAAGEKLQFTRQVAMDVKRPNRLHVHIHSPHAERGFWYDGKALTILDAKRNFYSTTPLSGDLDAMVDAAQDEFGIDLPLVDLALSDPYKNAIARVQRGTYFGLAPVMGFSCHHLAFTQDNIDWQVWIQDGPQPLIRKFVITRKNEPGSPEFTALITQWNLTERIAESTFAFEPPQGAVKIPMRKAGEGAAGTSSNASPAAPLVSPKEK